MHLKLQENVHLSEEATGEVRIISSWSTISWKNASPILRCSLMRLAQEGASEESLSDSLLEEGGEHALAILYHTLDELKERALLTFTLFWQEHPFLTLKPIAPHFKWDREIPRAEETLLLSPHATSFAKDGEQMMETALNAAHLILKSPESILLINTLRKPIRTDQLFQALPHLPKTLIVDSLKLLKSAKIL